MYTLFNTSRTMPIDTVVDFLCCIVDVFLFNFASFFYFIIFSLCYFSHYRLDTWTRKESISQKDKLIHVWANKQNYCLFFIWNVYISLILLFFHWKNWWAPCRVIFRYNDFVVNKTILSCTSKCSHVHLTFFLVKIKFIWGFKHIKIIHWICLRIMTKKTSFLVYEMGWKLWTSLQKKFTGSSWHFSKTIICGEIVKSSLCKELDLYFYTGNLFLLTFKS